MNPRRLRGGLVGGVLGSTIGILASAWWPPHPAAAGMTIAIGMGTGIALGLTLGSGGAAWLGTLFDSVWRVVGANRSR